MSTSYPALRAQLVARIKAVDTARKESATQGEDCPHSWQKYRQTVIIENEKSPIHEAYFVIRGCDLCKRKELLDFVAK